MEYFVKHTAGSTMYDLKTPKSDLDLKGVFVNRDPALLFGLTTEDVKTSTSKDLDVALFELRKFFQLLLKTNTNALETLYCGEEHVLVSTPSYEFMREHRTSFVNSKQLLKSVTGYMHGEFRFVNGERSGKLGGVRKEDLEKYGYSYKNLVHMRRLYHAAKSFFSGGEFTTSTMGEDYRDELLNMKLYPEQMSAEDAKTMGQDCLDKMKDMKDTVNYEFDVELACEVMDGVYFR